MFSTDWHTSPRQFGIITERNYRIPVDDGITLDSDLFRPDAPGRFPVLLAAHPYNKQAQSMPMVPEGVSYRRAFIESGDFNFYVIETCREYEYKYATTILNIEKEFNYNKCLNIGTKYSNDQYIAYCNNDLLFHKDWAKNILHVFKAHEYLSLCPILEK